MTVREALELLRLAGLDHVTIEDDVGDRYGMAGWVMDRPVRRIVVVPDVRDEPTSTFDPLFRQPTSGALAAAVDEIESRLVDPDDGDGPRPYGPHELCTTTHSLVFGGDGPHCGKCGVALTIEPIEPDA